MHENDITFSMIFYTKTQPRPGCAATCNQAKEAVCSGCCLSFQASATLPMGTSETCWTLQGIHYICRPITSQLPPKLSWIDCRRNIWVCFFFFNFMLCPTTMVLQWDHQLPCSINLFHSSQAKLRGTTLIASIRIIVIKNIHVV